MTKPLTPREEEILILLAEGQSNRSVADRFGISVRTVESHRARLMLKLKCQSVVEMIKFALRNGFIKP
jgi:DNA-binding CsgD family transcriptional regulator